MFIIKSKQDQELSRDDKMMSSFYEKFVGSSQASSSQKRILCIGLSCLDIVQVLHQYPQEDTDHRSIDCRWQRGGNASNNCTVLSILGAPCEFFGTLSSDVQHCNFLLSDMKKFNIKCHNCPMFENIGCPTSTVFISLSGGTRTIVHYNPDLPELTLDDFKKLNLDEYSWIHFEGRNANEVFLMMEHIASYNAAKDCDDKIVISLELERPRPELLDLLVFVDIAFVSKEFALSRGWENMSETLKNMSQETYKGATIICAWGDRGAMARTRDGTIVQSPAYSPSQVTDTLGAGDTFNASIIYKLNKAKLSWISDEKESSTASEKSIGDNDSTENVINPYVNENVLQSAITFACRVAGAKVGLKAYEGLDEAVKHIH